MKCSRIKGVKCVPVIRRVNVLVGVIGSMKSTKAKELASDNHNTVIVSPDYFREMFKGRYTFDESLENLIERCSISALRHSLKLGYDVVIDDTNHTKEMRRRWVKLITKEFPGIIIFATEFSPSSECLERRLEDTRGLSKEHWENVFHEMSNQYESVGSEEGFDHIIKITK